MLIGQNFYKKLWREAFKMYMKTKKKKIKIKKIKKKKIKVKKLIEWKKN